MIIWHATELEGWSIIGLGSSFLHWNERDSLVAEDQPIMNDNVTLLCGRGVWNIFSASDDAKQTSWIWCQNNALLSCTFMWYYCVVAESERYLQQVIYQTTPGKSFQNTSHLFQKESMERFFRTSWTYTDSIKINRFWLPTVHVQQNIFEKLLLLLAFYQIDALLKSYTLTRKGIWCVHYCDDSW